PRLRPRRLQASAPLCLRRRNSQISRGQAAAPQARGRRVRARAATRNRRMTQAYAFTDPRLASLDGFRVEIDPERERADVVLDRPPLNVIAMPQRDQLRLAFEALDADARVRIVVLRAAGEHFSSGGNIRGFIEASPEHVA